MKKLEEMMVEGHSKDLISDTRQQKERHMEKSYEAKLTESAK